MKRAGTFFLLGIILLVLSVIGLAQTGRRKKPAAGVTPNHPPTASLTASANAITLPCPPNMLSHSRACPMRADTSLQLTTTANDPDGDSLLYTYNVSGGRITGEGANVNWDLSGLGTGSFTATVEVDDGLGGVVTSTTTITIINCSDCMPIGDCPVVAVSCPNEVEPNSTATFAANITQGTPAITVSYKWTVSAGSITSGQGTSAITISTAGLGGQTVTATVEIGGIDPACNRTASCSTPVRPLLIEHWHFDEYGNIRFADEKARLDNFAIQLQNEPGAFGYIVGYGSCAREGLTRATRAQNYVVKTRSIAARRVLAVDGGCLPELQTKLWILEPGEKPLINAVGIISPCPVCKRKPVRPKRRSRPRSP